jgi:hypothetical protein
MFLVAIHAPFPSEPRALARAAAAAGVSVADIGNRLRGTLPRVLLSDADGDRLRDIGAELEPLGFVTAVCDARAAPTDAERVVARGLRMTSDGLTAIDAGGDEHECPWLTIEAIQRGARVTTDVKKETKTETKLDVGRALLSGGLILTRKEKKVTERKTETSEPFVLVQRSDGEPDIMLYERRIDYRFLGRDMQPYSRGNLEIVVQRLRAAAPRAAYDDRVARPGFVSSLPAAPVDGVDLALFLVTLARHRGGAG